jgi:hypothetical protein
VRVVRQRHRQRIAGVPGGVVEEQHHPLVLARGTLPADVPQVGGERPLRPPRLAPAGLARGAGGALRPVGCGAAVTAVTAAKA